MCMSWTQEDVLLTFCPPGPDDRTNVSFKSPSETPRRSMRSLKPFSFSGETLKRLIGYVICIIQPHHRPEGRNHAAPSDHREPICPRPWRISIYSRSRCEPSLQDQPGCCPRGLRTGISSPRPCREVWCKPG